MTIYILQDLALVTATIALVVPWGYGAYVLCLKPITKAVLIRIP